LADKKPPHEFRRTGIGSLGLWCRRCGIYWDLDQRTGLYIPYSFNPNTGAYDRRVGVAITKRPKHIPNSPDRIGAVSFGPEISEVERREFIQSWNKGEIFAVPQVKAEDLR